MSDRSEGLRSVLSEMDVSMVLIIFGLSILGLFFIFSAGYESDDVYNRAMFIKQVIWLVVGFGVYFLVSLIDYGRLAEIAYPIYAIAIILLLLVWVPGLGKEINNAKRWINMVVFNLQPSELMKPAFLLTLSWYLSRPGIKLSNWSTVFISIGILMVPFSLILMQPDLGTGITLLPIFAAILFVSRLRWKIIGVVLILAPLVAIAAWYLLLAEYQQDRILVFINPESDPTGKGWNAIQSRIAVASGGFDGKGYLKGTQNLLGFLPRTVAPTDFIFCVIAEEMGFKGSAVVIGLYTFLLFGIMRAAVHARDQLGRLIAIGVMTMLFMHVYVNIGMTVGLMPITGLPLPFLSYGGSVMIGTMVALGLVQSIYIRRADGRSD